MKHAENCSCFLHKFFQGGTFSGVETIFLADPQTETYVSQIQPSPREEASFPNYPLNNVCFGNEKSFMQDEYLNRILTHENLDNDEESSYTFVDNFFQKVNLDITYISLKHFKS